MNTKRTHGRFTYSFKATKLEDYVELVAYLVEHNIAFKTEYQGADSIRVHVGTTTMRMALQA